MKFLLAKICRKSNANHQLKETDHGKSEGKKKRGRKLDSKPQWDRLDAPDKEPSHHGQKDAGNINLMEESQGNIDL